MLFRSEKIKKMLKVFVFICCLVVAVHSQQNLKFCDVKDISPDPANLPFPASSPKATFELFIEKNTEGYGFTETIGEIFDGKDDVGIAIQTLGGNTVLTYSYYPINELLVVKDGKCAVYNLNESYSLTPFFVFVDQDGKEHIVTSLSQLFGSDTLKFVYISGSNYVRGIAVNEWQTCAYDKKTMLTYRITVSLSNSAKWLPAHSTEGRPVPVQILIETIDPSLNIGRTFYTVTNFRPRITKEEEFYIPPSGVFCPGRKNHKQVPTLPKAFSFLNQYVQPIGGTQNMAGVINYIFEEYDFENKLFRYDTDNNDFVVTEVHDFSTGLNYVMNKFTGNCTIAKIPEGIDTDMIGDQIKMRDPADFFDLENTNFQYSGRRRVNGVDNDVWIGQKVISGLNFTLEWYFLSYNWTRTDLLYPSSLFPISTIISANIQAPNGQMTYIKNYNHFFAFKEQKNHFDSFEIKLCQQNLERRSFVFTLPKVLEYNIIKRPEDFRNSAVVALQKAAKVLSPLRISNVHFDFEKSLVLCAFTIHEAAKLDGDAKKEISLNEAVENLSKFFANNQLEIEVQTEGGSTTILASQDSLKEFHPDAGYYVHFKIETIEEGYSSGSIFLITLIVTVLGISLGLLVIMLHKFKKIKIPYL